jgi:hypothetical protein
MSKGKVVWVLTGYSESGDDYGPVVFSHEPTEKEVSACCHDWDGHSGDPDEFWEPGPGFDGSYVYPIITESEVR